MAQVSKFANKEKLAKAIEESTSQKDVIRKMGLTPRGGNFKTLKKYAHLYNLDLPKYSNEGKPKKDRIPDEDLFAQNSTYSSPGYLKRRFLQTGVEYKCHTCGQPPYWNGHELVLQLEHIDGDISNNTLENLTIICPNCHSQTSTYRGKNKKNKGDHLYKKCKCGAKIRKKSKQCTSCATKQRYNTKYPPIEKLIEAVQEKGYSAVAREIGVSDNAVRKHITKTKRASKT